MAEDITATIDPSLADAGKLPQQVEITDAGPCKKHVKITVGREVIDGRFKEKYDDLYKGGGAQLPGFRPGKAPRKIVERKFKSAVQEEVRREVLMASLQQLAEDSNLAPLAPPNLNPEQLVLPEEGPFVYEFDVEVRPEFDLPEYKGMKLKKPVHTFTEKEITAEKQRYLENFGELKDKPEGSTVELNDLIVTSLKTYDGDKEINSVDETTIRVETKLALADSVIADFGNKLIGAKAGESRDFDLKLGETVADQNLRGKTLKATFSIKGIKTVVLPEMTQAMYEAFGVRNDDQMTEMIAAALERNLEYRQRQSARTQVLNAVLTNVKFDLPRDLLISQATRTLQRRVMEMRSGGMNDQQIEARMAVLRQNVMQSTAAALMEHFVLQKIAEVEKIEIEDGDIDREIGRIAMQNGESFRKVKAQMERDELIEALATDLLERKALDVVLAHAEYEEVPLTTGELEDDVASMEAQAVPGELVQPKAEPAAITEGEPQS
ncbi:trigger factor [Zavarzinella formosa]|uniref:trigger factor n=1 Tax=Zavarzinella formosa TaxID=360055 RepID=UPI0002E4C56D|nr:trigger factor [Zavarzinella formosa]